MALSNLGDAYLAQGDLRTAEALLTEAIDVLTETQSAGHTNVAVAQIRLGRTFVREGRYPEAGAHLTGGLHGSHQEGRVLIGLAARRARGSGGGLRCAWPAGEGTHLSR